MSGLPAGVFAIPTTANPAYIDLRALLGGGSIPNYATPGLLPDPVTNSQTLAIVDDVGDGSAGLYLAYAAAWCFLLRISPSAP